MPYAIELRFAADAEDRVREVWRAAAGFYGTGYLVGNGVIPHVALVVGDSGLRAVSGELAPVEGRIRLAGVRFFAGGRAAYLAARVSDEIAAYQRDTYQLALQHGCEVDPLYSPGRWIPHCTVAQKCTANLGNELPVGEIEAKIGSVMLVQYPPTALIAEKMANRRGNENQPGYASHGTGLAKGGSKAP